MKDRPINSADQKQKTAEVGIVDDRRRDESTNRDTGEKRAVRTVPRRYVRRANRGEPLGFLCIVNMERDRPQRPAAGDLEELRSTPVVGDFIRH